MAVTDRANKRDEETLRCERRLKRRRITTQQAERTDFLSSVIRQYGRSFLVARNRFIDSVAVEVIEAKLMSVLDCIQPPVLIYRNTARWLV